MNLHTWRTRLNQLMQFILMMSTTIIVVALFLFMAVTFG